MLRSEIAVLRFGLGARPGDLKTAAGDPRGWLHRQLRGGAALSGASSLAPSSEIFAAVLAVRQARRGHPRAAASEVRETFNAVRAVYMPHYEAQVVARTRSAVLTDRPFAERLVHFWSNHFAISADKGAVFGLGGTLENEAIRPHLNGRFVDMLTAVEQHPAMIAFLDNQYSVGTHSQAAGRAARRALLGDAPQREFGINENLAREILELHTLGVNGGYTQGDVTNFAQMLTGWSVGGGTGRLSGGDAGRFFFRENLHEPGAKLFMGKRYADTGLAQGTAALADLAEHPATAHHIATKLVRHLIADDPPAAAVNRVARRFLESSGDLAQVHAAVLDAPDAWLPEPRKFKTPEDLVFSALRALDEAPTRSDEALRSFDFLGQRPYAPGSPAGWPDVAAAWDGSDALMRRVIWAARVSERYAGGVDPRDVAAYALGANAAPATLAALTRAASAPQALTLLFMSPEFQRR